MTYIPGYEEEGFNAEQVDPAASYEPLPRGKYAALIVASENRMTKAGNGEYLSLKFKIIEGEYEGRFVYANLNMKNPSADAERIARQHFSAICHATGVLHPRMVEELHGIPILINVKVRPATEVYPAANDVSGYEPLEEGGIDAPW